MTVFSGKHSEWNLGSPGGWDYQRITQEIGKAVWAKLCQKQVCDLDLDFDHPLLHPVNGFMKMLQAEHHAREGSLIAIVAEEETLESVVENQNLAMRLNAVEGLKAALMAPHHLEMYKGRVSWQGQAVSVIFMDFNTDVLLALHHRQNLSPLLEAVAQGRVINPRGTEPINVKSMFEIITLPEYEHFFHPETILRTPWTRQFTHRSTSGPNGEHISNLVEWTRQNWERLVLKPERGYSGKGVKVGGIDTDIEAIIKTALSNGEMGAYIVQDKVPLDLWAERIPTVDLEKQTVIEKTYQTDFRCLFCRDDLFGFLGRYGQVPTNVGSGGGVQPLAILRSDLGVAEATQRLNDFILNLNPSDVLESIAYQKELSMAQRFTYLLGPIKIALRPRLITMEQCRALQSYCARIWKDCLTLEKMWLAGELDAIIKIESEELDIARSQPWQGSPAIFAADGLFGFGE